ncbi:MAG: DUF933 domain-containing protein [Bacillota bacterium]|nr:DUF933 domain-containing protein [Bacillota bacterium]
MIVLQIGLVGMPGSGKTTLFNLLTGNEKPTGPGGADEVYTDNAVVPDGRIDYLTKLYRPRKTTCARIEFKDIPGAKMEHSRARASRLLDEVRSATALVQVIRAFEATALTPEEPDPYSDLINYGSELLLADMDTLEKKLARLEDKPGKKGDVSDQIALYRKILSALENEQPVGSISLSPPEEDMLSDQVFLTGKPLFAVINIDEAQLQSGIYPRKEKVESWAASKNLSLITVCAQVEMEISRLKQEEQIEFMKDYHLAESGLGRLSRMVYNSLDLISFFTVGEDEVRAWTVRKGSTAPQAAAKIHSDISRGFIRAEVFHYDDLYRLGSVQKVKEAGLFRLEGKDYIVQDGDIISFRFNI